ncbi:uncharacterized protein LOC131594367 [Vicia villosa]|uniref:uncharacterized protein LOC131594367 n=1 Tax=Vicia villosa TaxID=3911 RepID=UPI00273A8BE5|nr:uncharacterized protein LOC131594367 [Vicia villosa]XP_058722459.1 uncharacterized protein LOC131594367 [Vicia villosa]XP_058722460.1 uncharacterized protein LOC131594367 [Vicia villosa]
MGYSLEKGNPFRGIGQVPAPKTIAKVLNIDISKIEKKGALQVQGFSRKYLEKKAQDLVGENQWDAFIDVLALIIYGIVLFPNMENFVDMAAISVFLGYKQHNANPVPAVLADVYYTHHVRVQKKRGMIVCCLPVLYTWLISHVGSCFVEAKTRSAWAQILDDLNEDSVLWYPQEQRVEEVIYRCGQFPNVPLIGTKGCINYNPSLALRQLGYPIVDKPADLLLKDFVLHDMGKEDAEMLRSINRAWKKIHRKGQELRRTSYGVKGTYSQWVKDRVKEIKLPWVRRPEVVEETPVQSVNINEEVSPLKAEEEIKNLQEELKRVREAYEAAQSENEISLERANKRAKVEEECQIKIQHNLQASNEQLKNLLKVSKIAEMNMQRELEDLKEQLKKVTAEYESQVKYERQQNEEMQGILTEYQDALRKAVEDLSEHKKFIEDLLNIKREFPTP